MWKALKVVIVVICAICVAAPDVFAQTKSTMKIPAGAKAEIHGNSAMISGGGGGGGNVTGSFSCYCSSQGTCSLGTSGDFIVCGATAGAGGCKGKCIFTTTTTGLKHSSPQ